jgi:hypothetical protein
MTLVLQKSLPPTWRPMLAAAGAIVPSGWALRSDERSSAAVHASRPVARLLLAGRLAEQFDHHRALRVEVMSLRDITSRLLAGLAKVRLVGGRNPQRLAEHVVMVIGEMLSSMPVVEDRLVRRHIPPLGRFETVRDAVGHHLREFVTLARMDLSRLPWRRRPRERWWQL